MGVSAVIIAENEARMLPGSLASLGFADEIVVVVSAVSADRTATLARRAGARVFTRKFDTFAKQKNFGIRQATSEWILVVDADERVTPKLAKAIRTAVKTGDADGYEIPVVNFLFGKRLRHGGWNERHLRLIRRNRATYRGAVHERFSLDERRVGRLDGELWHLTHRSPADTIKKTVLYADLWAAEMIRERHPAVRTKTLLAAPVRGFRDRYFKRHGYRDGFEGALAAGFHALGLFYFYAVLWSKQRRPSLDETYRRLDRQSRRQR